MSANRKHVSVIGVPEGSTVPKEGEWAKKIEKAQAIRDQTAKARKGRPLAFPTGMRHR